MNLRKNRREFLRQLRDRGCVAPIYRGIPEMRRYLWRRGLIENGREPGTMALTVEGFFESYELGNWERPPT